MHLEDFPMDAHACPLKFGSCKWPLYSDVNISAWTQTHKKTPNGHTHAFLTCCHYLFQLEVWPRCRSLIRDDSVVTAVLPEELSAKAPLVPCSTLPGPARPCKTLAGMQCTDLCLSMAASSAIFPEHHTSCSLLKATPALHHPWEDITRSRMMRIGGKKGEWEKKTEKREKQKGEAEEEASETQRGVGIT